MAKKINNMKFHFFRLKLSASLFNIFSVLFFIIIYLIKIIVLRRIEAILSTVEILPTSPALLIFLETGLTMITSLGKIF